VDLTATFRGEDPERPVHVGYDGTRVVAVLDTKHAELLAKMIARVNSDPLPDDDVDQVLWDHVVVDLMAAKAMAGPYPTPVEVPPLEVVR
ncbi:MAG TPA: hypothetical protein VF049_21315, partial [Nocardioidaceae bacterium]